MNITKAGTIQDILQYIGNILFGGSNGGVAVSSGKGAISIAHVAAVGSGGIPGLTTFTVTQAGASGGTVSSTINGGTLPAIDTAVTIVTGGVKYSIADTLAIVGGSLTGGQIHITVIIMDEYDFITVGSGVVFTELKDSNGTDLLVLKNLSGITFNEAITLNSGTNYKIRNMVFTGGNIFGYNV